MFENKWVEYLVYILIGLAAGMLVTTLLVNNPEEEQSQNLVVVEEESAHNIGRDCVTLRTRTSSTWRITVAGRSFHQGHWYVTHYHDPRGVNFWGRSHTTVSKCTPTQVHRANYPWLF